MIIYCNLYSIISQYIRLLFFPTMKPNHQKLQKRINGIIDRYYKKQTLKLDRCDLKNEGLKILLQKLSDKLVSLDLVECKFTGFGLEPLLTINLVRLKNLTIRFIYIGSCGMKVISKAHLPNLNILNLSECKIGDEGAKYLSKAKFPMVSHIWLVSNNIKLTGYQCLQNFECKKVTFLQTSVDDPFCLGSLVITQLKRTEVTCFNVNKELNKILFYLIYNRFSDREIGDKL